MISDKMANALNEQMNKELYSSYLYLSMTAYFEGLQLPGFATWMKAQVQEEAAHGIKIYKYITERGGRALMAPIDGPPTEWDSPLACFEAVMEHERKVTGMINDLMDLSISEKDHACRSFLHWFVDEQVEEEASVDEVLGKLKLTKDAPGGLFLMDQELGQRVFSVPAWFSF